MINIENHSVSQEYIKIHLMLTISTKCVASVKVTDNLFSSHVGFVNPHVIVITYCLHIVKQVDIEAPFGVYQLLINLHYIIYCYVCGLELPREPQRSTRLLQLTGR